MSYSIETLEAMAVAAREEADRVFARAEQAERDGDEDLSEMLEDYYNKLNIEAGDARQDVIDKRNEGWVKLKSEAEEV